MTNHSISFRRRFIPAAAALAAAAMGLSVAGAAAAPMIPQDDDPVTANQEVPAISYTLDFRWSAWGWLGLNGVDIVDALRNNTSEDGDILSRVSVMYAWDQENQAWMSFFPNVDLPGINSFDTFTRFQAYFIAITEGPSITFTPPVIN